MLVGLDGLADCGWTGLEALQGFVAHELGHLAHAQWRGVLDLPAHDGPLWKLYSEGFAQRCEHRILGRESFHMQTAQPDWLGWCHAHEAYLAGELLRAIAADDPAYHIFGSWPDYAIEGHTQCGYYLGHQVIAAWEDELTLREIATLPLADVAARTEATLKRMAE